MTRPVRILVLGDSALASLGGVFRNAIDDLAGSAYQCEVHLLNGSAVGMTAADAWVHFTRAGREPGFDAAVLYAGNCDACAHGYLKPRVPRVLAGAASGWTTAWNRRRNPLAARNPPLRYLRHAAGDRALRRCVLPADYAGFVRDVARVAAARRQHVFVLVPESKRRFPAVNNTGNYFCYKVFGVPDQLEVEWPAGGSKLAEALRLHGDGQLSRAMDLYSGIVQDDQGEDGAIAANNLAAIHFAQGDYAAARRVLGIAAAPPAPLRPLLQFNRAVLAEATGDADAAEHLFQESRASDTGTYRITPSYRAALANLPESPYLHRIDLGAVLDDADFMDYCHPTEEGHRRIAARLRPVLESSLRLEPGNHPVQLVSRPRCPDAYTGAKAEFFHYFNVVPPPDPGFVRAVTELAVAKPYAHWLNNAAGGSDARTRAMVRILKHPLCGDAAFLRASPPEAAVDQGALPELYALRHLLGLAGGRREHQELRHSLGALAWLLPQPARVGAWWPALGAVPVPDPVQLQAIARKVDPAVILERVRGLLRANLNRGPVHCDRYRTMTYWFLREAMLFGTASHPSAYFDRLEFQNIALTGLFLQCYWAASSAETRRCRDLMQVAAAAVDVHLLHLTPWAHCLYRMPPAQSDAYRRDLAALAAQAVLVPSP